MIAWFGHLADAGWLALVLASPFVFLTIVLLRERRHDRI